VSQVRFKPSSPSYWRDESPGSTSRQPQQIGLSYGQDQHAWPHLIQAARRRARRIHSKLVISKVCWGSVVNVIEVAIGEGKASGTFEVSVLSSTVGEASAVIALDSVSPWVDD
jgi:hypothetical protein